MKWTYALLIFGLFAACRKSTTPEQEIVSATKTLLGKWKLVQYYKENTDGTGVWLPTDTANLQTVSFAEDGTFTHNENFVVQESINRYKFLDPHKILLYSTTTNDSAKYFYRQDYKDELIFNPLCIEFSCMRRWIKTAN